MKKNSCIILILVSFVSLLSTTSMAQKRKAWKLVWQDEFNYTGLPDSSKWGYETGHIRNNEQQYYTRARTENVMVSNGMLVITGRKENYTNAFYKEASSDWRTKNPNADYTSASINTFGKVAWKYGRVEVKAKLPMGGGIWPAIWMMGANRTKVGWPKCGEMDIMEYVGNKPLDIYATVHFPDSIKRSRSQGSKTTDSSVSNQFHLYAMEWNSEKIDFWFDNKKYFTFIIDCAATTAQNPFRKPFYLLINLAMGANWPGPIDDAVLPQPFLIDYVRVYKLKK